MHIYKRTVAVQKEKKKENNHKQLYSKKRKIDSTEKNLNQSGIYF